MWRRLRRRGRPATRRDPLRAAQARTSRKDNPFGFHPGETWTPALVLEFMRQRCQMDDAFHRAALDLDPLRAALTGI